MIVETFNVRGVGGSLKLLTLKRFLEKNNPDVLFIQETMVGVAKAREAFVKILPNWIFCGVDSIGLSGGFLTAWNHCKADFFSFLTPIGIILEGFIKDINLKLKMINCYGSYVDRVVFGKNYKGLGSLMWKI
jgi:hypothetical protein